jgi:outer membrane immunogenic protein
MKVHPISAVMLASALAAGAADAADHAVSFAAAAAPAPVGDWRGIYAGAALGAKWGDVRWTTTRVGDPPITPPTIDASSPRTFEPDGARVGGFLGYNLQSGNWIYGAEVDIAHADATESSAGIPGCTIFCYGPPARPGPGNDSTSVALKWDASARLRLGHLVRPNLLLFGTGGIAWQRVEASATCESTLPDPVCLAAPPFGLKTQTNAATLRGWTAGAGAEWKFAPKWVLRGEYRYADYGTKSGVFFQGQPSADPGADAVHYNLKVRTHFLTAGVVFRFN